MFLKFTNFYLWFIKNFLKIAILMTALTWKNSAFKWINKINEAFKKLKTAFTLIFILMQFDSDRETVVEADSLEYAIRNLLLQYDDNEVLRSCTYFFKWNTLAECNYQIYDKKLLAIICCLQEWDSELCSVKNFKIIMNHLNLKYFMIIWQLLKWQMQWADILSRFNFTIIYQSEKETMSDIFFQHEQNMFNEVNNE